MGVEECGCVVVEVELDDVVVFVEVEIVEGDFVSEVVEVKFGGGFIVGDDGGVVVVLVVGFVKR